MSITVVHRRQAPEQQQEESFGAKLGSGIRQGLDRLVENKIADLQKRQGIKDRKALYGKMGLPDWMAEMPDEWQDHFVKQFELSPVQDQEAVREDLGQFTQQYMQDDEDDMEDQQQESLLPQQMMQGQQSQRQPYFGVQPVPENVQQEMRGIPSMNSLMQAGENQRAQSQPSSSVQDFPSQGRGVSGQPAGMESYFKEPSAKKYSLVRKGTQSSSPSSLTPQQQKDEEKKLKSKEAVQKAFDRTQEILDAGYTGYTPFGLTPEGRKQRSELDTLSEVFISKLIPLLNPKGTISKERFNYIKSLAPNSWDTDATIKGKLEALKEIFELEGSSSEKSTAGTLEMRDAAGEIYDIPQDMVEEARKGGLR